MNLTSLPCSDLPGLWDEMRINLYWLPWVIYCSFQQQASRVTSLHTLSPQAPRIHGQICQQPRQGFQNASQNFQVLSKQSLKPLQALRCTVWMLLQIPSQRGSQN